LLGAAVALLLVGATAALSRTPLSIGGSEDALLRLSWRNDGIPVEQCRERSAEELAALPVHMRAPTDCSGGLAPYRLRLIVDGALVVDDTIRPAGARGDRPVYVLREHMMSPGDRSVVVRYEALLPDGVLPSGGITEVAWEGSLSIRAGTVALVTLDASGTALEVR
jgi:hypothetical protein